MVLYRFRVPDFEKGKNICLYKSAEKENYGDAGRDCQSVIEGNCYQFHV